MTRDAIRKQLEDDNPTLTKIVNGKTILVKAEERGQLLDFWAQNVYEKQIDNSVAPAQSYQVRVWLIRNNIHPDLVSTLIKENMPIGPEQDEALQRWEYSTKIFSNHPLVLMIAEKLNISVPQIWKEILEIQ